LTRPRRNPRAGALKTRYAGHGKKTALLEGTRLRTDVELKTMVLVSGGIKKGACLAERRLGVEGLWCLLGLGAWVSEVSGYFWFPHNPFGGRERLTLRGVKWIKIQPSSW